MGTCSPTSDCQANQHLTHHSVVGDEGKFAAQQRSDHDEVLEDNNKTKKVTSAGIDDINAMNHESEEQALDQWVFRMPGSYVSDEDDGNDDITSNDDTSKAVGLTVDYNNDDNNKPNSERSVTLSEKLGKLARNFTKRFAAA